MAQTDDSSPDLVFNLLEMFVQNLLGDVGVLGLMDSRSWDESCGNKNPWFFSGGLSARTALGFSTKDPIITDVLTLAWAFNSLSEIHAIAKVMICLFMSAWYRTYGRLKSHTSGRNSLKVD